MRLARRSCSPRSRLPWPGPALAHSLGARFGDFYGGLLHPTTALELALPLVALGLLAGQNGKAPARRLLVVLPAAFASARPGRPAAAAGLGRDRQRRLFLVLGLLLALDWALPRALLLGLGAALGLIGGLANSTGMAGGADPGPVPARQRARRARRDLAAGRAGRVARGGLAADRGAHPRQLARGGRRADPGPAARRASG